MPPSRRDDLIRAAIRVFQRNGYHASGLDMILREGGLSRMTLYNHFKSKDDLIVAALRRIDEEFRHALVTAVEAKVADPRGRLLAVFDFWEGWLAGDGFEGCPFINASSEYFDDASSIRRAAADHKQAVVAYLRTLCEAAGLPDAGRIAQQLGMLLQGAVVQARVVGAVGSVGRDRASVARLAKETAAVIIGAAEKI